LGLKWHSCCQKSIENIHENLKVFLINHRFFPTISKKRFSYNIFGLVDMHKNRILPGFQDCLRSRKLEPEGRRQQVREFSAECIVTVVLLIFFLLTACGPKHRIVYERRMVPPEKQEVKKEIVQEEKPSIQKIEKRDTQEVQYGVASWYGPDFHGKPTSSGEIYDMYQLTCAHNTFPLGTTVMVTNLENGRSIELKINDRGPFVKERIIDLSYAAAQMLGMWEKGTAYVKVEGFGPLVEEIQRFTVQVGSFIDEANAQKLADQLRKGFENVYVNTLETLTQKYHRVRVGQFEAKESALNIAEKLSQMGFKVLVTNR
jgi:rare lipoprotein A